MRVHGGNPLTAYNDQIGVPTIRIRRTMRNDSVRRGRPRSAPQSSLLARQKITAAKSDALKDTVLSAEYVPAVVAGSRAAASSTNLMKPHLSVESRGRRPGMDVG